MTSHRPTGMQGRSPCLPWCRSFWPPSSPPTCSGGGTRTAGRVGWRHALGWRLLIGLFMGGQIALVLWILGGRVPAASSLGRPPQLLSAAAYLWHLLLLPAAWALVATTGILFGAWRWGRPGRADRPSPARSRRGRPRRRPRHRPGRRCRGNGDPPAVPRHADDGHAAAAHRRGGGLLPDAVAPSSASGRWSVALPGLPPELDGLRIALVSDLHVGTFTNGRTVQTHRGGNQPARCRPGPAPRRPDQQRPGRPVRRPRRGVQHAVASRGVPVRRQPRPDRGRRGVRPPRQGPRPPARQRVPGRSDPGPARPVARPALEPRRGPDRRTRYGSWHARSSRAPSRSSWPTTRTPSMPPPPREFP